MLEDFINAIKSKNKQSIKSKNWKNWIAVRVGRKSPHSGRKEMTNLVKEKSPTAQLVIS